MGPFLYRCPRVGQNVQGFVADDADGAKDTYVQVNCLACRLPHLVNPRTGKLAGEETGT
jgi:hypothetical protein